MEGSAQTMAWKPSWIRHEQGVKLVSCTRVLVHTNTYTLTHTRNSGHKHWAHDEDLQSWAMMMMVVAVGMMRLMHRSTQSLRVSATLYYLRRFY